MYPESYDHGPTLVDAQKQMANFLADFGQRVVAAISKVQLAFERKQRRDALLLRRSWKAADRRKLLGYGFHGVAERRIQAIEGGRGRPVVRDFRSFPAAAASLAASLERFFGDATPYHERLRLLKTTSFWPPLLEGVLEGERAAFRDDGRRNAAERARRLVASRLGLSESSIAAIVAKLRRDRAEGRDCSIPTSLRLTEMESWLHGDG